MLLYYGHNNPYFSKNNQMRFIPHGTVDNNLGTDRFAGSKALDPYY